MYAQDPHTTVGNNVGEGDGVVLLKTLLLQKRSQPNPQSCFNKPFSSAQVKLLLIIVFFMWNVFSLLVHCIRMN